MYTLLLGMIYLAFISPYIMSYALTHTVWTDGYRMNSCIQFGILVVLILGLQNQHREISGLRTRRVLLE
ncbi:MAG: hypothetical protein ACI4AD_08630 [Roseburia sp.]